MINLIEVSRYRDGGTSVWMDVEDKKNIKTLDDAFREMVTSSSNIYKRYYLDNRIESNTKGELFDKYPSDEGSQILDKSNFNFVTQEQLDRDDKIDQTLS